MNDFTLTLNIKRVGFLEADNALRDLDKRGRQIVEGVAGATGRALGDIAVAYERGSKIVRNQLASIADAHDANIKAIQAEEAAAERASARTFSGFGRVRQGLTSLVAQMTGTIPVLDRIGGQFLTMGVGSGLAVGVVAGVAAIAAAWRFATADARQLSEETDKAVKSLLEWNKARNLGVAGQLGADVALAEQRLTEIRARMAALQQTASGNAPGQVGEAGLAMRGPAEAALRMRQKELADLAAAEEAGIAHIAELRRKASQDSVSQTVSETATIVTAHKLSANELRNANSLLASLQAQLNALTKTGGNEEARAKLIDQIKQLNDALHPKDPDADKRQKALDKLFNTQNKQKIAALDNIDVARRERVETERRVQAARDGEEAERKLTDQLEIEKVTREFLHETTLLDEPTRTKRLAALLAEVRANQELNHTLADEDKARKDAAAAQKKAETEAEAFAKRLGERFSATFGKGISAAFTNMFSGNGVGGFFKSLTGTILSAFGSMMEEIGLASIGFGKFMSLIAVALKNPWSAGPAMVAYGVGMIAFGAALQAAGGKLTGGGSGSFSSSSGSATTPSFLSFSVQAPATSTSSSPPPKAMPSINIGPIIGTADPQAQRDITKMVEIGVRRGLAPSLG